MKNDMKSLCAKALRAFCASLIVMLALVCFAACNDRQQNSTGGDSQPPAEQTTVSASDLLDEMNENGVLENALHHKSVEKLAEKLANQDLVSGQSAEVEHFEIKDDKLSVIYKKYFSSNKNDFAFASFVADLPSENKLALSADWKDLILDKMSQNLIDESQLDAAKTEVNKIVDEVIENLANKDAKVEQKNTYTRNNPQIDNITLEKLRAKFGSNISVGAPREDESVVIISLDKNGNLIEHLCQIYYTGTGEIYGQIATDDSVKITDETIDLLEPFVEPALRPTMTAKEIFDQVFGKDFVLPSYEELLQNIISKVSKLKKDVIATGVEKNFCIYTCEFDTFGREHISRTSYTGTKTNFSQDINQYSVISDIIKNFTNSNVSYVENTKDYSDIKQLFENSLSIKNLLNYINDTSYAEWKFNDICVGTKDDIGDFNKYGAKLLEDVEYNKIIKTVVGRLSGRTIDTGNLFDTGYVQSFDLAVLYSTNEGLKLTTTKAFVPHYIDHDNKQHYEMFFSGFVGNVETTPISDSIILTEQGAPSPSKESSQKPQTVWLDERSRKRGV